MRAPFVIKTDHQSLCHLGDQNLTSDLQRKAMTTLVGLQFSIQYRKGVENTAADALSRVKHAISVLITIVASPTWVKEVINNYHQDEKVKELGAECFMDKTSNNAYSFKNGILRFHNKIVVGKSTNLRQEIL